MAQTLYASVTSTSGIESITIADNHTAPTSTATVVASSTSLGVGDSITIRMGYSGQSPKVFTGYVKNIDSKSPPRDRTITAANDMVRAVDYFIAASDPTNPLTYDHISAEDLVKDLMKQCGLTKYDGQNSNFTFGINNEFEVNLTSVYDYSKFIADIIAYSVYCDEGGTVHFRYRPPFPDVSIGDTSLTTLNNYNILDISYAISDKDLRNRIVVYGANDIHAEAKASSPYLPNGFYKSMVVAAPTVIDTQEMAQKSADYNLPLVNRLTKSCQISILGNPQVGVRDCVTVNKSDLGVTGLWYVYSIEQSFTKGGFTTVMDVRQ